jgi:hypothetical protein
MGGLVRPQHVHTYMLVCVCGGGVHTLLSLSLSLSHAHTHNWPRTSSFEDTALSMSVLSTECVLYRECVLYHAPPHSKTQPCR